MGAVVYAATLAGNKFWGQRKIAGWSDVGRWDDYSCACLYINN